MMRSFRLKLFASAAVMLMAVGALPLVGVTESSVDEREGVVLDFGYWDIEWIELPLSDSMTGYDALTAACAEKEYEVTRLADGSVYSVNEQVNLIGVHWAMYVLTGGVWAEVTDPAAMHVGGCRLVSWARAGGADSLVPGTDYTGFGYYSYAVNGQSLATGKALRVVTLAPSVTETVAAVGGLQYIIGTDLYSNYPQAVADGHRDGSIAITGGYIDPNYEWIIKLDPDLVFCDGDVGQDVAVADKLRKSGVDCVVLYGATDVGAMYDNLWITACALGLSANANAEIAALRSTIDIVSGIAGETGLRVFAALSADPSPWTAGANTFMSDIIACAGAKNVFESQSSSWFMVSKEQIYAKQPQVIIILSTAEVTTDEEYRAILDGLDPVWKETPAYRNGEVFVFSGAAADILSRPGPRLAEATELLAKIMNPDAFLLKDPLDAIPQYFGDDYTVYLKYQREAADDAS